jgi:hypothetical protein
MIILSRNNGSGLATITNSPLLSDSNGITKSIKELPSTSDTIIIVGEGYGEHVNSLTNTHAVFGSSSWTDKVNLSVKKKIELAIELGLKIPEYKIIDKGVDLFLSDNPDWERLSDNVAVRPEHGMTLCAEGFYERGEFSNFFVKIYGKKLLYGEAGPDMGISLFSTFTQPNIITRDIFDKLAGIISEEAREYRGPVTIETVSFPSSESGRYSIYRNIHFGYDPLFEMSKVGLCGPGIITGSVVIPKGYCSGVVLFDPLLSNTYIKGFDNKWTIPIDCVKTTDGIVSSGLIAGLGIGIGENIHSSFENAYEFIRKITSRHLCYRPDGAKMCVSWWKNAKNVGII